MWRPITAAIAISCWACPASAMISDYEIGVLSCSLSEPSDAAAASGDRTREVSCTFQPKEGVEETYIGTAYGVSISVDEEVTFIWAVRSPSEPTVSPASFSRSSPTIPANSLSKNRL